jgi:hypothetical protein
MANVPKDIRVVYEGSLSGGAQAVRGTDPLLPKLYLALCGGNNRTNGTYPLRYTHVWAHEVGHLAGCDDDYPRTDKVMGAPGANLVLTLSDALRFEQYRSSVPPPPPN